jgi:excisionase family DNA binding protein
VEGALMTPDQAPGTRHSAAPKKATRAGRGDGSGEPGGGRWLSINAACAYLGVDQSTLRRWSDAGKVPVFRTPGGHRRYAEADLRRLIGDGPRPQERPRVSRQALTDRSLSAYEEEYLRAARERRWFRAYGPATQEEHRRLGRRLVDLAIRYAAVGPAAGDRASFLAEGRQIGEHYGRAGAAHGLTPGETVEAFLYFRYPVVRAVTGMIEEEELAARRAVRLFAEIGHFMDQVLIATVQAHEAAGRAEARAPSAAGQRGAPVLAGA